MAQVVGALEGDVPAPTDELCSLLGPDDACMLVDILKIALSRNCESKETLAKILSCKSPLFRAKGIQSAAVHRSVVSFELRLIAALAASNAAVRALLVELCVTELEDVARDSFARRRAPQPVVQESSHPYIDDITLTGHVKIPGTALGGKSLCQRCKIKH